MFRKHLLCSVCLFAVVNVASGQSNVINDGATVIIEPGARINIQGNLINQTNTNDGLLNNSGRIAVSGDWINNAGNAALVADQGLVVLDGNQAQTIGGSNLTGFNNLELSGDGQKSLAIETRLGVVGVLDLGQSELLLSSNTLNLDNPSPAAIVSSGGGIVSESTAGDSVVAWSVGTATGTFSVPFETVSGVSIPMQSSITTAGTGPGRIEFATYPTPIGNTPLPAPAPNLDILDAVSADSDVTVNRFWLAGNNGFTTIPAQQLTITYDPAVDLAFSGGNLDGNLTGVFFSETANDWVDGAGTSDPTIAQATVLLSEGRNNPITVVGINDRPEFSLASISIVVSPGDQGAQTVLDFVSAFDLGALDDIEQAASFLVVTDDPGQFDLEPAISADGTLTFIPGPNANGAVTATVTLVDGGGSEFGGLDASESQTFSILLSPLAIPVLNRFGLLILVAVLLLIGVRVIKSKSLSE